jgi:hypothetical protein
MNDSKGSTKQGRAMLTPFELSERFREVQRLRETVQWLESFPGSRNSADDRTQKDGPQK